MSMNRQELLSAKPFSMSLSSGFFGYFAHLGFAVAFEEQGLKPSSLSGSSAGALVAAGLASGRSAAELAEIFLAINKNDFWDPALGFGYLKGQKIEDLLAQYCAPQFDQLQIPLHISVFNILRRKTEVITEGSVAKACRASASVPGLFHPVKLGEGYFWDGGIGDRAGHRGTSTLPHEPVIHYLGAEDWVSRLEDRWRYRHLHQQPFFFKISSPHKVGPDRLENGKSVFDHFKKQASLWLQEKP